MSNDLVIYKGSRRFVDDVISDIEKRVDALEGDGEKRKAMNSERDETFEAWVEGVPCEKWAMWGRREAAHAAWIARGDQAARQSAGATDDEREAFRAWRDSIPDFIGKYDEFSAWVAWQAARRATGQEPIGYMRPDELAKARVAPCMCRVHPAKDRQSDMIPVFAAPVDDNGAKIVRLHASGGTTGYSDFMMSDGSVQTLKVADIQPEDWRDNAQPDGGKRVELTDADREAIKHAAALLWNYRRIEAQDTIDALRELLARASAKGE